MSIRRIAREKWGLKRHVVEILYNAVMIPIVTYGAIGWFDKVTHSIVKRHLLAAQRSVLLLLTRACRTASTVSLQVVSGKPPIDLEIAQKGAISRVKRNMTTEWRTYQFRPREEGAVDLKLEAGKLERAMSQEWQVRWDGETRGRNTYSFIKDVSFVRERSWFRPCRETIYVLTGYGPINSTLFKRGITEDCGCAACGEEETVDHMIFDCTLYRGLRDDQLELDRSEKSKLIDTEPSYKKFNSYTRSIFEKERPSAHCNSIRIWNLKNKRILVPERRRKKIEEERRREKEERREKKEE